MRILLRCDLDPFTGDSLGLILALLKRGADIYLDPCRVITPLPADIAVLLTKDNVSGYDLILHHGSLDQLGLTFADASSDTLKIAWAGGGTADALRLDGYDLVIAYDADTAEGIETANSKAVLATGQGGYPARDWTATDRDWFGPDLGLAVIGEPHQAVARTFLDLSQRHPEEFAHVDLTVHTDTPAAGKETGVRYVHGLWDAESWHDFYADHHLLIVPPRTKDIRALQFMSTGGSVIASRGGGAQQWLSSAVGWPVDWDMQSTSSAHVEQFRQVLRTAVAQRDDTKRRAETASRLIPEMCSWEAVLDRLLVQVADRVPGRGERFAHLARVAAERAKDKRR